MLTVSKARALPASAKAAAPSRNEGHMVAMPQRFRRQERLFTHSGRLHPPDSSVVIIAVRNLPTSTLSLEATEADLKKKSQKEQVRSPTVANCQASAGRGSG